MSKAVKPEAPQKVDYNDAVAESKKYFDGDDPVSYTHLTLPTSDLV